jgi:hypothetical protein
MENTKDWNLLSENEKQYWILIYKGHSKLNGHDPVPNQYIKHLEKIQKDKEIKDLEQDKKDNPWKYIKTYLGKKGRVS